MSQAETGEMGVTGEQIEFEQDLAMLADKAREAITQFVQERPHAALGLAAAAGFILGGGLTPRRLVRLGMAAGGPTLTRQIAAQMMRMANDTLSDHEASSDRGTNAPEGGSSAENLREPAKHDAE